MKGFGPISRGIAIATLLCFAAPQAQAIEIYGAGTAATGLDDGMIVQVRGGRGGGGGATAAGRVTAAACIAAAQACTGGGGMHRGGGAYRGGGVHRGGAYHGGAYRGGTAYRGGAYRGGAYRAAPTEAVLIVARLIAAAPTVMAVGHVRGTAGHLAARSQPAQRLAL